MVESECSQIFHQWLLDALSIPHYVIKKERPRGARHGKTEAQKQHFVAHIAMRRCIKKNYEGIHDRSNEIQKIVTRNSKLAGPRRSPSQCISWHRKTTPTAHPMRSMRDIKTLVSYTEQIGQEYTDETSIRLSNRSHINEPSPPRIRRKTCRTNPFSTVPKVAPVFFQFFTVELGKTGGAHIFNLL